MPPTNTHSFSDIAMENVYNLTSLRSALTQNFTKTCIDYSLHVELAQRIRQLSDDDLKRIAYQSNRRVFSMTLSDDDLTLLLTVPDKVGALYLAVAGDGRGSKPTDRVAPRSERALHC